MSFTSIGMVDDHDSLVSFLDFLWPGCGRHSQNQGRLSTAHFRLETSAIVFVQLKYLIR